MSFFFYAVKCKDVAGSRFEKIFQDEIRLYDVLKKRKPTLKRVGRC
jgi:hypothetical protein